MKMIEPPEGIIVTLPARFFEEYTWERYEDDLKRLNVEQDMIWYRVCKNLPKMDVLYVYTIIDNKIHHRTQFAGLLRNTTMRFTRPEGGIRTFENANSIRMCGPVIYPEHELPMRGFQGFRYTKKLF